MVQISTCILARLLTNRIMRIKGYISKAELNDYLKYSIEQHEKKYSRTPTLRVWKSGDDLRWCKKGMHILKVEIDIKIIK